MELLNYSANNTLTQILVDGWKLVHSGASDRIKAYIDGEMVYVTLQGSFTMNANADTTTGSIPSDYAPNEIITVVTHSGSNNKIAIQSNGTLVYHNFTSTTTQTLRVGVTYPLKARMP